MSIDLDEFLGLLKSELFVLASERFFTKEGTSYIVRGVGKHPLLKPEPIVVNDQLMGFKKIKKKRQSLEDFPVFFDIEGYEEEGKYYIDHVDLYVESELIIQEKLSDVIYLSQLFHDVLVVDRVLNISNYSQESIRITSLINDAFSAELLETDEDESVIQFQLVSLSNVKLYIEGLLDFTYAVHGLIHDKKTVLVLESWLTKKSRKRREE